MAEIGGDAIAVCTAATAATSTSISAGFPAKANRKFFVTHFSASVLGSTGLGTIESPAGTVIWQKYVAAGNPGLDENFTVPIPTFAASAYTTAAASAGQGVVFKLSGMIATNESSVNGAVVEEFN